MSEMYKRLSVLGSGTFGEAWLCRHRSSGRLYVVKSVKVVGLNQKEREQALTEVSILAKCQHINVIRYRDAYVERSILNIVMEYAELGDLHQQIVDRKGAYFPENIILDWFVQISFALRHIHGLNILHRDLKPKNIFLSGDDVIKVGDFGIARALNSTNAHANTAIGTPYYLSPEICQQQPYNHKSDMWAAGCVLYELCTLKHPFDASDMGTLMVKILHCQYLPIPSSYGALLEDLVSVLLKVDVELRPSSEQILRIPALQPTVAEYVQRVARERGTGIDSPRIYAPTPANTPTSVGPSRAHTPDGRRVKRSLIADSSKRQASFSVLCTSTPSPHSRAQTRHSIAPRKRKGALAVRCLNTPSPDLEASPQNKKQPPISSKRQTSNEGKATRAKVSNDKENKEVPKVSLYKEILQQRQSATESPPSDSSRHIDGTTKRDHAAPPRKEVNSKTYTVKSVSIGSPVKYQSLQAPKSDTNAHTLALVYETTCLSPSCAFDKLETLRMELENIMSPNDVMDAQEKVYTALKDGMNMWQVKEELGPRLAPNLPLILQLVQLEAFAKI